MRTKKLYFITQAAMIAAIYVVMTVFINTFNLASGTIQVRISEVLTVLPYFTPAAVPGVFIGCLLSNLLTGAMLPDIVFGSLATLLGALGSCALRKHSFLVTLPPVLANMLIIPFVLRYAYGLKYVVHGIDISIPFQAVTVGAGEVITCCIFGSLLIKALSPYRQMLFHSDMQTDGLEKAR
ncbi:MAG: QueT transporter family protein [Lachnospiraceae bacterium]|nr:QueT transporter family protein [Lachnospiraceae bacterium]